MRQDQRFRELLTPARIGRLELRNRIVMPAMGTNLGGRTGLVTDRLRRYHEERARGGVGLIIVEITAVDHPRGVIKPRQLGISDDKFIPGLAELADTIHRHGARVGIQLQHGGRMAADYLTGVHEPVAPSPIPFPYEGTGIPRELSVPEIVRIVECFALGAARARKAGIDGVEIHAGHGYLINQFLSRSANRRQDAYGGSLENRARFLLEIIGAVRSTVGTAYPVWCRLDGREFAIENGITAEDAREVARLAENAGVDAIHVSGYGGSTGVHFTEAPLVNKPGHLVPLARGIKRVVKIPVIAVGRISPELGERVLRQGDADFIAMGRPLIADPELPNKLAAGRADDIRKCIYCYTCVHQSFVRREIRCSVNAVVGRESDPLPGSPERAKRVLVVGGGPAGLEAARVAASRGHEVMLYEKERHLGGSLLFASVVRQENENLIRFLVSQAGKLGIRAKPGTVVSPDLVEQLGPDTLVLAAGAARRNPAIPGIDMRHVLNGDDLRQMLSGRSGASSKLTAGQNAALYLGRALLGPFLKPSVIRQLARFWMPLGKRVTIIGGGIVGCELAAFLSDRNRRVTILEAGEQIAQEMALPLRWIILDKLDRNRVTVLNNVRCDEIASRGVIVVAKDGSRRAIEADNIIVATGVEPDQGIRATLQGKTSEVYLVGDCARVGLIEEAIADGYRVASSI